jgi:hypothetical protein
MEQVDASIARYLRSLDQADREESDIAEAKSGRLKEKIAGLRRQMTGEWTGRRYWGRQAPIFSTPFTRIPDWATAHPANTSCCLNPLRVRFNGVNSKTATTNGRSGSNSGPSLADCR